MSGWASILSAASALLGTLAGFWATARKRAEAYAEMRVQLAGLLTLTEELRQEQRRQGEQLAALAARLNREGITAPVHEASARLVN